MSAPITTQPLPIVGSVPATSGLGGSVPTQSGGLLSHQQSSGGQSSSGPVVLNAKDKALLDRITAAREAALNAPTPSHAQRQWSEVTVAFDRLIQQRKLSLCAFISPDACTFWASIVDELLSFASSRCLSSPTTTDVSWIETELAVMHEHGLFAVLQHCCEPKLAVAMVGEPLHRLLIQGACRVVATNHLAFLAKVYTTFCDVCKKTCAKKADTTAGDIDSRAVDGVRAVMNLLLTCCTNGDDQMATALTQQSEPAALISKFLYGLKMRSQHSQLFCPAIRSAPSLSVGSTVLLADTVTLGATSGSIELSQTRDGSGGLARRGSSTEPKTPNHRGGSAFDGTRSGIAFEATYVDPHSPNPTAPLHGGPRDAGGSPGPSETQMRPLPSAHESTPIDYIHAQALEVLVEVVRRRRTRIVDCPSCSTVVLNLCSYVSVNVHMAEPESTHDDCLAILYNVQTLLRALQAMMVDTMLTDNRHAVIEEVLKENQGESLLELVRMLVVRVQGCMQADLAVLDALHNFLSVAAPFMRDRHHAGLPKANSNPDLSPPNIGISVHAPPPQILRHQQPPMAATLQQQPQHLARTLLGSSFDPMNVLARSSATTHAHHNFLIGQTPRDGSEAQSFARHSDSSLNTSFSGAPTSHSHPLPALSPDTPEHALCKSTLAVFTYFAKSSHMLSSVRAVACEWIRSFVFGLSATVPVDALPRDVQDDPIEFFLSVARGGGGDESVHNAAQTLPMSSLHSKNDRTFLLSCSFHGLHSLFHHAHCTPRAAQLDEIASIVISDEVIQSPRLLSQTLLVWSSCLTMLVHHRPPLGGGEVLASLVGTNNSTTTTARGQSETSLALLLQHITAGTLVFAKEGSVELPLGECRVDPGRWESSLRRPAAGEGTWGAELAAGTSPVMIPDQQQFSSTYNTNYSNSAVASHENSLAPGAQHHQLVSTTGVAPQTAVSLLELISKVCLLVLSSTQDNTSEALIVAILGLLEVNCALSTGGAVLSTPLFGSAASSPNHSARGSLGAVAATSIASFADRCVMSLVHTYIPRAMPLYVDTLATPRLAAAFLPYLLQVFDTSKKSQYRPSRGGAHGTQTPERSTPSATTDASGSGSMTTILRAFALADGVSVATGIIADILRDGDDAALLQQLFQLIGPFMDPTFVLKEYTAEVDKITRELVHVARREEAQAALGQTIIDAAVGVSSFSIESTFSGSSLNESSNRLSMTTLLHCTRRGPFLLREPDCAACHPHFLDLVPPLLTVMLEMGHSELYEAYLDALFLVVEATGQVKSMSLLSWAIANGRTTFLRHLHIPLPILNGLPFTKTSADMRKFWAPLLRQAPRRSALRFRGRGGITVSVDSWPEAGLSISCWFLFHEVYPTLPLFEIIGVSENSTPVDDAVSIEGGETIAVHHNATTAASLGGMTATTSGGPGGAHKKRSVLNEDTALSGLEPRRWLHFTLVISPARVMTLYFYGRAVGSSAVPAAIIPNSHAQIHLGLVSKHRDGAFFSLGEVQLWHDELTAPQVLADYCGSDPQPFAPKLLPADVPREWLLATVTSIEAASLSRMPMTTRVARFEPHSIARRGVSGGSGEHQQINLCGHSAPDDTKQPVTAHIQYGLIAPPYSFVHFHKLFLSRGGLRYLAQWVDGAKSETDLTEALQVFAECVRVVHMSETMRPRLYTLVAYFLKRNIRAFLSKEGALYLVRLAMVLVPNNEQMHAVLINRMAVDHLLCDMDLVQEMRQEVALVYIAELSRCFDPTTNKCARRNFEYVLGKRLFDKLLHGFVRIAPAVARTVHIALVELLRNLMLASDCHIEVLSSVVHIVAVLSPQSTFMDSQYKPNITVAIPQESRVTTIGLPFRLMHFLAIRLLRLIADVTAVNATAAQRVSSLVSVPWYLAIVQSRFVSTTTVVLATRLMADAVAVHPPLTAEFKQHLYIIACALELHAYDTNVVVFLLAAAVGLHVKINLADTKRGILKQLDDVMTSSKTDVRPVFSALFAATFAKHLHLVSDGPRLLYREQHCHWQFSQHLSWRTRRFFSAVRVIAMLTLRVNAKRYARRRKTQPGTGDQQLQIPAAGTSFEVNEQPSSVKTTSSVSSWSNQQNPSSATMPPSGGTSGVSRHHHLRNPYHDDPLSAGSHFTFPPMAHSFETPLPSVLSSDHPPALSSAFPSFHDPSQRHRDEVATLTPPQLGITAPAGQLDVLDLQQSPLEGDDGSHEEHRSMEEDAELLGFPQFVPLPPPITAAELFQVGHMKPLSELPPLFRRAMTKLLVIVRCFRLPLMHTRYDAFNNKMRLRQQAAAKDGLPCIAATREIYEPTHFLLSATKSLAAHTNMFPVFAGGVLQHDLIAFLASMESVRSDRLLSASHIPAVDLASTIPTSSAAAPPAPAPISNTSTASMAPEEALSSSLRGRRDGGSFSVDDSAHIVVPPSTTTLPVVFDTASETGSVVDGGMSGAVGESISVWYDDDDSASSSSEAEREEASAAVVDASLTSTVLASATVAEDSDHFALEQLFDSTVVQGGGNDSSFSSPLAAPSGGGMHRATTFRNVVALQDREAVAAHARDILGVIVRTSLCAHDAVKLWGEHVANLQSDGVSKDHLTFLLNRYGPCGALLGHCLTSFLGTTTSIKEDSFRITMIFCAALAPVLKDLSDYYTYLFQASAVAMPKPDLPAPTTTAAAVPSPSADTPSNTQQPRLDSGSVPIPTLTATTPTGGAAIQQPFTAAPAATPAPQLTSATITAMKQNEPAIVKNLVLFIVFLCDRVVTNILSFEAVLPFLIHALKAVERSTTEMCAASADQAMSASARKDLGSTTLRITAGQLIRSQILRVVVIVLSLQEPSPSLLEHILVAVKAALLRDQEPRQLDELLRVLYVAFKTPPVRHFEQVQLLLASIWQCVHNTCALSPRFKKATTLKGITQVISLTKEIGVACTGGSAAEVQSRLEQLFRERREDLDSVFSARPKAKFDDAVRREHRMKKDYQEHIPPIASARKAFRTPPTTAQIVTETYWSLFGSMADSLDPVSHVNAHWLYFTNNAVHGTPYDEERYRIASVESFRVLAAGAKPRKRNSDKSVMFAEPIPVVTVSCDVDEDEETDDDEDDDDNEMEMLAATIYPSSADFSKALLAGKAAASSSAAATTDETTPSSTAEPNTTTTISDASPTSSATAEEGDASQVMGVTPSKLKHRHYYDTARNYVPFLLAVDDEEDGEGDCTLRAASRSASIVDASVCEEMTSVVSVFCPQFICRCPPIPQLTEQCRMFHPECTTHFTDSARFLLRYLLSPGERVRHICNAFRVDGLHSTPCVVILTDAMLKVYASARITTHGDILIGADELLEELDQEDEQQVSGPLSSATSSHSHITAASFARSGGGLTPKGSPTTLRRGLSTSFRGLEKFARRTTQRIQSRVRSIFTGTEKKRLRGSRLARSLHASTHGSNAAMRGLCWFYYNNNVTKMQKVQYMHQDCAVLVSLAHDNGPLLAIMDESQSLNNTARDQFYSVLKKILTVSQLTNVAFLDETTKTPILEVATERWVHRSCSTYEYLLTLNSIANRVRKDWNQYPVFPWVLKNYNAGITGIDLNAAENYRDLQWPIGAQLEQRREELKVRYDTLLETSEQERLEYEADNPAATNGSGASNPGSLLHVIMTRVEEVATGVSSASLTPGVRTYPFHHGSHYSSSAGVLHYLIRTEPFATRSKIYQGGSFDHPDRLFHSVQDSFHSCTHSSADCKELIPEFYSRGQFLLNSDRRVFGARQDGRMVDGVTLPPWAQGSPHVFVAIMRMALESEHVSQRLHKWIDLVFGPRQQGKLSVESFNVFQRFSYGDEVLKALGATHSIQECRAIVSEVENFGQTPIQVFAEFHPKRRNAAFKQQTSMTTSGSSSLAASATLADGQLGGLLDLTNASIAATDNSTLNNSSSTLPSGTLTATTILAATSGSVVAPNASIVTPQPQDDNPLEATQTPLEDLGLSSTITSLPTTLQLLFAHAQRHTVEEDVAAANYRPTAAVAEETIGRGNLAFIPPTPVQMTSRFVLLDANSSTLVVPHPNLITHFAGGGAASSKRGAVVSLSPVNADAKYFADADRMRLIPESDLCLCWYKHEERLLRYRVSTGEFHSAVQFEIPEGHEDMEITSVIACRREVFLCLGTSTGIIYCLHPDSIRSWCVLGTTLCVHTNPIKQMVASERLSRLVSVTNNVNDPPIVWRIQRLFIAKLHHLPMDLVAPETDRLVTGVAMCPREGNTFVSTTRRVAVFDSDGTPWGVGKLPSPADADSTTLTVFADVTTCHQFLTSDWCDGRVAILTGHVDGSIGLWCVRRNSPATIAPHAIVTVQFLRLIVPPQPSVGFPTTFRQPQEGQAIILVGYSTGVTRELRFEESFLVNAGLSNGGSGGNVTAAK